MKSGEIEVGGTYSDKARGLRRVLEIGSHLRTCGLDEDATGVRYEVVAATKGSDVGAESTMELKSFAAWAKEEVPADAVQGRLIGLQADKVVEKLTQVQRDFLLTFDGDLSSTDSVECPRKEFRAAAACRAKGIITSMPDRLHANERFFEVSFSALGLAVLARALAGQVE